MTVCCCGACSCFLFKSSFVYTIYRIYIGLILKLTTATDAKSRRQERQKYEVLREEKNDAEMEAILKGCLFVFLGNILILMWETSRSQTSRKKKNTNFGKRLMLGMN